MNESASLSEMSAQAKLERAEYYRNWRAKKKIESDSVPEKISTQPKRQRAEYFRLWRARNPGKSTLYQERYWERRSQLNNEKASDEALTARSSDKSSEAFFVRSDRNGKKD